MDDEQFVFDYESVFDVDDYLYFYSEVLTDDRSDAQVQALVQRLVLDRPMRLLDLACGFGRHANRLAALGHQVVGLDIMPGFLDIARVDAEQRGVQVDYRLGDMRTIDFDSEFDRVMLLFTAFGYFDDEQNLQVLRNAARALKPGGLLVFDTHNRDVYLKNYQPFGVVEKDGNLQIDRKSFDTVTGCFFNRRIVIRDGQRRDKPFFVRLYNASEVQWMLKEVGLEPVGFYSDWQGSLLSIDKRPMIVLARKPQDA